MFNLRPVCQICQFCFWTYWHCWLIYSIHTPSSMRMSLISNLKCYFINAISSYFCQYLHNHSILKKHLFSLLLISCTGYEPLRFASICLCSSFICLLARGKRPGLHELIASLLYAWKTPHSSANTSSNHKTTVVTRNIMYARRRAGTNAMHHEINCWRN